MILDARAVDIAGVEADICIIGGGPAGLTLASAFIGSEHRVALLESGDVRFNRHTQLLAAGSNLGDYDSLETRRRMLGGTTTVWDGRCIPLDDFDFEVKPWLPGTGWPLNRAELDPYYRTARAICHTGFDAAVVARRTAELDEILAVADAGLKSRLVEWSPPVDFGAKFAADLAAADNVSVYVNANALCLGFNRGRDLVDTVQVATLGGNRFNVKAARTVLAAGGIENPRLLLESGVVVASDNGMNLVGAYFMEHPYFEIGPIQGATAPFPKAFSVHGDQPDENNGHGIITFDPEVMSREELVNCAAYFRTASPFRHSPAYTSDAVTASRQLARYARRGEIPAGLGRMLGRMVRRPHDLVGVLARGIVDSVRTVDATGIRLVVEMSPNPLSRVSLSSEVDPLGCRKADVDWRLTEVEERSTHRFLDRLNRLLAEAGLGRLPASSSERWPAKLQPGAHHMGTTRMHTDPRFGVVNGDGRVHGVRNLYVAGSSLFPTSGIANPTLTIVALAVRLADHLREED